MDMGGGQGSSNLNVNVVRFICRPRGPGLVKVTPIGELSDVNKVTDYLMYGCMTYITDYV